MRKKVSDMKKSLPPLTTDKAARDFLENTDLSQYMDAQNLAPLTREYEAKDRSLTLRLSEGLLNDIKAKAAAQNMAIQKYVRKTLEQSL